VLMVAGTLAGVIGLMVVAVMAECLLLSRCVRCGAWASSEEIDNPRLSPVCPILRRCKKCGYTEPATL
jgi:hypothetical protein